MMIGKRSFPLISQKDLQGIMKTGANREDLKKFGLTLSSLILLFYYGVFWFLLDRVEFNYIPLYMVLGLVVVSLILPRTLKPLYIFWMILGGVLGFFNTQIILGFVFFFIFTPISLLNRLFGKSYLDFRYKANVDSYFIKNEEKFKKNKMKLPF